MSIMVRAYVGLSAANVLGNAHVRARQDRVWAGRGLAGGGSAAWTALRGARLAGVHCRARVERRWLEGTRADLGPRNTENSAARES